MLESIAGVGSEASSSRFHLTFHSLSSSLPSILWICCCSLDADSTCTYWQEEEEEDGGILGNGVKDEVEEDGGILGNAIKYEADAVSSLPTGSKASMNYTAKVRRRKKDSVMKTMGAAAAVTEASASCKKSDGKGWHCKRRAQHPHSLCHYHLAQLRSYSCNHSHGKASEPVKEGHGGPVGRRKKTDVAGADSNFYYYYCGFGPWRGKTRGGSSDNGDQPGGDEVGEGEDGEETPESGTGYDATVAGGDEDEGVRDRNDGREGDDDKRSYRKRGRKRMKARSLKSLL